MDTLFARDGHWDEPPPAWPKPERALEERKFFDVLQVCVEHLPPKIVRVFMMREWLGRGWLEGAQ